MFLMVRATRLRGTNMSHRLERSSRWQLIVIPRGIIVPLMTTYGRITKITMIVMKMMFMTLQTTIKTTLAERTAFR